ncbi:hypothetical protein V8E53_012243 [Lactarius tabidus]
MVVVPVLTWNSDGAGGDRVEQYGRRVPSRIIESWSSVCKDASGRAMQLKDWIGVKCGKDGLSFSTFFSLVNFSSCSYERHVPIMYFFRESADGRREGWGSGGVDGGRYGGGGIDMDG